MLSLKRLWTIFTIGDILDNYKALDEDKRLVFDALEQLEAKKIDKRQWVRLIMEKIKMEHSQAEKIILEINDKFLKDIQNKPQEQVQKKPTEIPKPPAIPQIPQVPKNNIIDLKNNH